MVLLKYLLKLGKMLEEGRFNSMRLVRFDEYKAKDHYSLIHREIEESSAKYEKIYLDYIKYADVKVIREVNHRFREFTMGSHPLGPDFYAKLGEYFQQTTKTSNEAVAKIVNDSREE